MIGLSFLAVVVNKYQVFFISLGIVSNVLGALMMVRMVQKHRIKRVKNPVLKMLLRHDLGEALRLSFVVGAALLIVLFITS